MVLNDILLTDTVLQLPEVVIHIWYYQTAWRLAQVSCSKVCNMPLKACSKWFTNNRCPEYVRVV